MTRFWVKFGAESYISANHCENGPCSDLERIAFTHKQHLFSGKFLGVLFLTTSYEVADLSSHICKLTWTRVGR